ncbi:MAG: hypothetical protein ACD_60C00119G0024 [uncultured bacterium]|nr:MAG: hypothetical protein ACD_60C00119G0024 [uncultured bacterium]
MLKHIIAIIILSIVIIVGMSYAQQGLQYLLSAHDWVSDMLKQVFSVGPAGSVIRQLIALLVIPVLTSFIPALIYWLTTRHKLPYFMELVWVIWLIQTAALVITFKPPA